MRDPFTWSFPLGRLFGISIRVHILFPLFALAMILRAAFLKDPPPPAPPWPPGLWLDACLLLVLAFIAVLLHELGHCLGARMVEGDAAEVLMWPLGGLANVEVPHTPKANFIAAASGPAVNLLLCIFIGIILAACSFRPALNPWSANSDPLAPRLYKWTEGIYYGHSYRAGDHVRYMAIKESGPEAVTPWQIEEKAQPKDAPKDTPREFVLKEDPKVKVVAEGEQAMLAGWQVLAARFFWINWVLLLLNLLPAFPLDGGRMVQSMLWARSEFRQATLTAVAIGFIVMLVTALYGMVIDSVFPLILAMFIYMTCKHHWYVLETGGEEPLFGYDFSQGYNSLDQEQQPAPARQKKPNFIQRWLQRRAARRQQREQEEREAEERRLDELLEKVKDNGVQSLTDEERRFLTRVSSRYKNRNSP